MHEILVGLNVSNEELYAKYRKVIMSILKAYNGCFGYDSLVSEVLISEVDKSISRVFTIKFSDKENMDNFF